MRRVPLESPAERDFDHQAPRAQSRSVALTAFAGFAVLALVSGRLVVVVAAVLAFSAARGRVPMTAWAFAMLGGMVRASSTRLPDVAAATRIAGSGLLSSDPFVAACAWVLLAAGLADLARADVGHASASTDRTVAVVALVALLAAGGVPVPGSLAALAVLVVAAAAAAGLVLAGGRAFARMPFWAPAAVGGCALIVLGLRG